MKAFGLSDIGKVRSENQDCFAVQEYPAGILAVVCDGMGGAAAGKTASELACSSFVSHVGAALDFSRGQHINESLIAAADRANRSVYTRAMDDVHCEGMGSTLVAIYATAAGATLLNVGDSCAYRISEGKIKKLTHDHSLVQEWIDRGQITPEQAIRHPRKNIITRVIGGEITVRSDLFESEIRPGDVFLLCSDGLINAVSEQLLADICSKQDDPQKMCEEMIASALASGARDNVTVVTLIYEKEGA